LEIRRFASEIPYSVTLALPLYRPPSQSVDRFVEVLKERLAGLFTTEPSSNFARFDIITLIKEMQSLAKV
jgi:hypothetical protein